MGRLSAVARSARAQRSASRRGDSRAGRRARPKLGDLRGGRFARPWWREVGEQSLQTQAAQPWPGLPSASFCVAMVPSRGHSSHRSCAPWAGHWSAGSERPRAAAPTSLPPASCWHTDRPIRDRGRQREGACSHTRGAKPPAHRGRRDRAADPGGDCLGARGCAWAPPPRDQRESRAARTP